MFGALHINISCMLKLYNLNVIFTFVVVFPLQVSQNVLCNIDRFIDRDPYFRTLLLLGRRLTETVKD